MPDPSVVVTNYGCGMNSVLLVNRSILDGIRNAGLLAPDGDLTRKEWPLAHPSYGGKVAGMVEAWIDKHGPPDVLVAQACHAKGPFKLLAERYPHVLRVLQRDSSCSREYKRILDAEYKRLGLRFRVDGGLTNMEAHEYDLAHRITVLSRWVERTFEWHGYGDKTCYVGPQTIDLERWTPMRREPDGIDFRVLFAGQAIIRKGIHLLCEAWRRMNPRPAEELLICGVVGEDGERADFVQAEIDRTPNCRTIRWAEMGTMPQVYAQCDVYCLPSLEEGSSCTCNEALACGRPLVASTHSGSDLLEDYPGEIGVRIETGDVDSIVRALEQYRGDASKRMRHGQRAREVSIRAGGAARFGRVYARAVRAMWEDHEA